MPSHRANTSSDKDTRKSRAVRLGALLLAVVGVTAAATSAGFTNDAWFSANASSANVSLQGSVDGGQTWVNADSESEAVELSVPGDVFADMVPGEKRTVELDLRNSSTVPVTVTAKPEATGDLVDDESGTAITVTDFRPTLEAGGETKATLTVTAGNWSDSLQNQKAESNTIMVVFTGTPVAGNN